MKYKNDEEVFMNNNMDIIIKRIICDTNKSVSYYLNGGCYVFAKALKSIIGGDILYLINDYHFVVKIENKLYDASGNVTKKYQSNKYLEEKDFFRRTKLVKEFIICD